MDLTGLPRRRGGPPATTDSNPHQQLDENAPHGLQEDLLERARSLPGVRIGPSGISVPGARALHLDPALAGAAGLFLVGREFAHLHPPHDGSLHLVLSEEHAQSVLDLGWGELHPVAAQGLIPPTTVMIYGPRDAEELKVVWDILRASHAAACGP